MEKFCPGLMVIKIQGKCVEIKAHSAPIRDLHYSKDNTMLLSSSNDKILKSKI